MGRNRKMCAEQLVYYASGELASPDLPVPLQPHFNVLFSVPRFDASTLGGVWLPWAAGVLRKEFVGG